MDSPLPSSCPDCGRPILRDPTDTAPPSPCHYCQPQPAGREESEAVFEENGPAEGIPLPKGEFADEASPVAPGKAPPFRIEGKWLRFGCPNCENPIRIRMREASESLIDCSRCGLEIIPPDPQMNVPAHLTRASAAQLDHQAMQNFRIGVGAAKIPDARPADPMKPEPEEVTEEETAPVFEEDDVHFEGIEALIQGVELKSGEEREKVARRAIKPLEDDQISSSFQEFDPGLLEDPLKWEANTDLEEEKEDGLRQKLMRVSGVLLFVVLISTCWHFWAQSGNEKAIGKLDAMEEEKMAERTRFLELAQGIVGREDWRMMLPDIRQPERVQSIMGDYYRKRPDEPVRLVSVAEPKNLKIGKTELWQAVAKDSNGIARFVAFEKKGDSWRLDWEAFVNVAASDWNRFQRERPPSPTVLRVIMCRCSPLASQVSDAGISPDNALGVRVWHNDRADSFVAIVEKDSFLGWQVEENLLWDAGALFIVEASFPVETDLDDRIQLDRLLQRRWLYGVDDSGLKVEGGTATAQRLR